MHVPPVTRDNILFNRHVDIAIYDKTDYKVSGNTSGNLDKKLPYYGATGPPCDAIAPSATLRQSQVFPPPGIFPFAEAVL